MLVAMRVTPSSAAANDGRAPARLVLSLAVCAISSLQGCSAAIHDDPAPRPPPPEAPPSATPAVGSTASASASAPAAAPPIVPIRLDQWLDASKSPGRRLYPPPKPHECIADAGCPFKPPAMPPCPGDQAFVELSEETLGPLDGTATVVRATLWDRGLARAYGGTPRCCHGKDPPRPRLLRRSGTTEREGLSTPPLSLWDARFPEAFACQADESATCCALEPNVDVLAYGTIRLRDRRIEDPRLCRMPL